MGAVFFLYVPAGHKEPEKTSPARPRFINIGTGAITGVYYPVGGAIASMVNQKSDMYGIRFMVESTGGSVFNINAVMAGDLGFGIVQSDRQYQAVNGTPGSEWDSVPQKDLRAVFSIHPETCTLVAGADAGISTIEDLGGKKVNIGNPGSGHRKNAIDALTAVGLDWKIDLTAFNIKAVEAPGLLQNYEIDAFFYTVGHPNANLKEAICGNRQVLFVPITGPNIDKLIATWPYYAKAIVPIKGNYNGTVNDTDIESFGVKATVVTSVSVPDDVVYAVVREVFENFDTFRALHPALAVLTREDMLTGLTAPIHPGALRYYKNEGLK